MDRGQVTIEFVLILIVILVIITTVSIPLVNYASDTLRDTGNAVLLKQDMDKILGISRIISSSGCNSSANITIDKGQLNSSIGVYSLNITDSIHASYMLQNGTNVSLKPVELPNYVDVSCVDKGDHAIVMVRKDCNTLHPNNNCKISVS